MYKLLEAHTEMLRKQYQSRNQREGWYYGKTYRFSKGKVTHWRTRSRQARLKQWQIYSKLFTK